MLVLTRRPGESICIGQNVSITVLAIAGNRIRLGISAPREVTVLRTELAHGQDTPALPMPLMREVDCSLSDA